ncbi:helix-turn-helix domain-containing protein [Niabella aurantiaca]|uniref:helix-turn-helix domain-containing protein n=1 Tax=Niabella aurantiaca TaxID=379900 RepID=UPI00036C44FD|nr:helix-turn-helix transcriptional regulator [Niabella aurantiaca]
MSMKSLGKTLKNARELIPFTLRQVEEAVGISNAYLSQLENDKIKKPSANVLYKLANLYNVELDSLLAAAGIIQESKESKNKLLNTAALSAEKLTVEEEEQLLKYLKFLRNNDD